MKKSLFFLLLVSGYFLNAQQTEYSYGKSWRFGLNFGVTKVTSDLTNDYSRGAGGFTIEKGLTSNEKSLLSFDLRYRFLKGSAIGKDTRKNNLLEDNKALNGVNNVQSDYLNNGGFFLNNYKTSILESDLELKIGLNSLLRRKKIHLYFWGGVGFARIDTKIDALDQLGNRYDFSSFSSSQSVALENQNMFDGNYESSANGNDGTGFLAFSPSGGFGIGYKFSRFFSLIYEHKLTFPASDLVDGEKNYSLQNKWTKYNDYFTYGACKLLFSFGKSDNSSVSTYSNPNIYSNVNNLPPDVKIISPSQSSYSSPNSSVQVYANVKNVTDQSGVSVSVNGTPFYGFNFTPVSGAVSFVANLNNGNNVIVVSASNNSGTDSEVLNVSWIPANSGTPPKVNIYSPINNSSTQSSTVNVNANVSNVAQFNQVQVTVNGNSLTNFLFNPSNGDVNFMASLSQGNNIITVAGTNQFGNDYKTINIYQSAGFTSVPAPVVTILNPPYQGFVSNSAGFTFSANVTGVTSTSQLGIKVNGNSIYNYSFNSTNGSISIPATLSPGSTSISISATNAAGSDIKTSNVVYTPPGNPPVVTFLNPISAVYSITQPSFTLQAQVTNVVSANDIQLYINNQQVNGFSFNTVTKFLSYQAIFTLPVNVVTIIGSNSFGADSKSVTINYNMPSQPVPVVNISNPANSPHISTSPNFTLNATVLNVASSSQISVSVNGLPINSFSYNLNNKQLVVPMQLMNGTTSVLISAVNSSGSDTKTASIVYNPAPQGNPPVVTILNPSSNNVTSNASTFSIQATVTNVNSPSNILFYMNNQPVTNFSFNSGSGVLSCQVSLITPVNQFVITGTNNFGSDSKAFTINYLPLALPNPVIAITNPPVSPYLSPVSSLTLSANVFNVTSSNMISVSVNGNSTSAFNYNNTSKQLLLPIQLGSSVSNVVIVATNSAGSATATTSITYTASTGNNSNSGNNGEGGGLGNGPGGGPGNVGGGNSNQLITICHYPPGNTNNPQVLTIPQSAWAAHQAHGDVLGGCPSSNGNNGNSGNSGNNGNSGNIGNGNSGNVGNYGTSENTNEQGGGKDPLITICFKPAGSSSYQTLQIPQSSWSAYQAQGAVLGICSGNMGGNGNSGSTGNNNSGSTGNNNSGNNSNSGDGSNGNSGSTGNNNSGNNSNSGNGSNGNSGSIGNSNSTNNSNSGNGDNSNSGSTGNNNSGNNSNNDPTVTICHYPPGNTSNPQQISIPQSAWPAHQAHGDLIGGCPPSNNGNGGGNNNGKGGDNGNNGNGGKINNNSGGGFRGNNFINFGNGSTKSNFNQNNSGSGNSGSSNNGSNSQNNNFNNVQQNSGANSNPVPNNGGQIQNVTPPGGIKSNIKNKSTGKLKMPK